MGKRGTPKKPTEQKVLEGQWGAERQLSKQPRVEYREPDCPVKLAGEALTMWKVCCKRLAELGVLADTDGYALTTLCLEWQRYINAIQKLAIKARSDKVLVQGDRGDRRSPYATEADNAFGHVRALLKEFGLTPAARAEVEARHPGETDPLAALLADEG